MSNSVPSSYRVHNAVMELAQVREMLISICPDIEQDEALFHDMLEGEAADSLAVIERLIEASVESDALADAAKLRQADLAERRARFEKRSAAYRTVALQAMEQINLRKIERGHFTASISNRPAKVVITDEAALLPHFVRTKTEPDKTLIAAALKNGVTVEGAQLSNGGVGLTVRTK
jgi:hypothetical protein